jgi:hypothetical protein
MREPILDPDLSRVSRNPYLLLLRAPRVLVALLLAYAGIALMVFPLLKIDVSVFIQRAGLPLLGLLISVVSFSYYMAEWRKIRGMRDRQFIDVDDQSGRNASVAIAIEALREEIRQLRDTTGAIDEQRVADLIAKVSASVAAPIERLTFREYYYELKSVLQEKAANADAKASLLLDRGVGYSRFGIFFFILTIVTWQILSWEHGFRSQFIYGIASCSLLFIFIEFLSAWFLRQYVHFVDTSTYLMKVKAIFDRYLLTYLVALDEQVLQLQDKAVAAGVLTILKDEIKWPDTYLLKEGDVSFAREVMESLAAVAKAIHAPKSAATDKTA